jgi:hypothetical protein
MVTNTCRTSKQTSPFTKGIDGTGFTWKVCMCVLYYLRTYAHSCKYVTLHLPTETHVYSNLDISSVKFDEFQSADRAHSCSNVHICPPHMSVLCTFCFLLWCTVSMSWRIPRVGFCALCYSLSCLFDDMLMSWFMHVSACCILCFCMLRFLL